MDSVTLSVHPSVAPPATPTGNEYGAQIFSMQLIDVVASIPYVASSAHIKLELDPSYPLMHLRPHVEDVCVPVIEILN